ncbi:YCF48-related protein [Pseudomonas kermanshahensis]|uniref:WD40/YVTN/BNR-like repeat-containing protein n=1 Tax=Pseudomonas kermanshahensis TaxID=2745482 RepID=UPI0023DA6498|nr:YCF48-related protein [Pseudomonas kermanshahensis]WEL57793.1 YCF48-related protein [Pseudomonas kermanshahensis]
MRQLIAYLVCITVAGVVALAFTPRAPMSVADTQLNTGRVQINGLLNLGKRQVAVGERGSILISDDRGHSWQQATVQPQRHISLTGLTALNATQLVAVGQDGWILRSQDAGSSWQEVHIEADAGEPLLGVWAAGGQQVFAFGSYGKFYQSNDGGASWKVLALEVDRAHLNAMDGGQDGRRMLVGEQGLVMLSADNGQHWQQLPAFYNGSLFGVVRLSTARWVAYGMRGNVFVTDNFGQSWHALKVGSSQPLYGHVLLPGKAGVLIVGAGSTLVRLDGEGRLLGVQRQPGLGTLTSAIVLGADQVLVAGERGVFQGNGNNVATLGKREPIHEAR